MVSVPCAAARYRFSDLPHQDALLQSPQQNSDGVNDTGVCIRPFHTGRFDGWFATVSSATGTSIKAGRIFRRDRLLSAGASSDGPHPVRKRNPTGGNIFVIGMEQRLTV